jgi:hypothetical protein
MGVSGQRHTPAALYTQGKSFTYRPTYILQVGGHILNSKPTTE